MLLYSATYIEDVYVDSDFAQVPAALIQRCKNFVTDRLYHDALRSESKELTKTLFAPKEDSID